MSGIFYKNRPYVGGGGSGGAGGGNVISYGYTNPTPTASDNDGDIYYLLDANNKKKGVFLYMTDEWVLIDGSSVFTLTLNLLDSLVQQNYSVGNTVYTALSSKRLIAVNFNINGEASSKNLTSQIMTTGGTVVSTNTETANWSNPNRNHSSTVSIIDVDANDTVTLTGITDSGSYTTQLHAILEVTDLVSTTITLEEYAAKSDGNIGTSKTVSLSGKLYMIIVFESSGAGATDMSVGLTTTSTSAVDEDIQIPSMFAAKIMIVDTTEEAASVTMTWASKTNYVSRGYAIYSLT